MAQLKKLSNKKGPPIDWSSTHICIRQPRSDTAQSKRKEKTTQLLGLVEREHHAAQQLATETSVTRMPRVTACHSLPLLHDPHVVAGQLKKDDCPTTIGSPNTIATALMDKKKISTPDQPTHSCVSVPIPNQPKSVLFVLYNEDEETRRTVSKASLKGKFENHSGANHSFIPLGKSWMPLWTIQRKGAA
jgi:hypothetical protein